MATVGLFSAFAAELPGFGPLLAQSVPAPLDVGPSHYLVVSALVFGTGLLIVMLRRNAIAVLMGLELCLNSAGLNFIIFSRYVAKDPLEGHVMTLFIIVLAAAEAALALAIGLNVFNSLNTIEVDEARSLKG